MISGITGTNSSGKETVAEYLKNKDFEHFSLSDELRIIAKERKIEPTRDNLIALGKEVRKRYGTGYLAERVIKKIKRKAVVSSIRNLGEIERLKKERGFILLAIDAKPEIRFKRAKKRNRLGEARTLKEFLAKEKRENSQESFAQQLALCLKKADYKINNSGTLKELYEKIEKIFKKAVSKKTCLKKAIIKKAYPKKTIMG